MASRKRDTQRGFGDPCDTVPTPTVEALRPVTGEESDEEPKAPDGVELELVREQGGPGLLTGPWRAFEIWTQNHVYGVDATMRCREVIHRATGATTSDHPILGQRLLGGQRRDADGRIVQVSHPLPARGATAVFAEGFGKRVRVSETSKVTRVVVRQRVVDVDGATPRWEDLTGDD